MPLKKDLMLSSALVLISGGLLIAASGNNAAPAPKKMHTACYKIDKSTKPVSPWNFMTEGFLHFSV